MQNKLFLTLFFVLINSINISNVLAENITVTEPWMRATVSKQKVSAAFMSINSKEKVSLVKATTPISDNVEIHQMTMAEGIMRMRQIPDLAVTEDTPLTLKPGGYHLMLFDLKKQIKIGEKYPLTLYFKKANGSEESVNIIAEGKR